MDSSTKMKRYDFISRKASCITPRKTKPKRKYLKVFDKYSQIPSHANNRREIGVIMRKADSPKIMKNKERLQNIISINIEREKHFLRRKYILNHPVLNLLERNKTKIHPNEIFLDDPEFNIFKSFKPETSLSRIDKSLINGISFLNIKQKIYMLEKSPKKVLNPI